MAKEHGKVDGGVEVSGAPFGPDFFLGQLRAFARDRCPDPAEGLPVVQLHLMGGEVLDLCHVIGLAPAFVALAVREPGGAVAMRTELVPYQIITRVTIGSAGEHGRVGFNHEHPAHILGSALGGLSPEVALRRAAGAPILQEQPEELQGGKGRERP